MNIIELLLSLQLRGWYRISHFILALLGLEIPKQVIFSDKKLIVGKRTVVGANAVLTQSTGDYKIWSGIPARKIGIRKK